MPDHSSFANKAYQNQYMDHRCRLAKVRTKIDNKPKDIPVRNLFNSTALSGDYLRCKRVINENLELMQKFQHIKNTHGKVDCYPPRVKKHPGISPRFKVMYSRIRLMTYENLLLSKRILCAKSKTDSGMSNIIVKDKGEIPPELQPNQEALEKYKQFVPARERCLLPHLLRPKIHFDIAFKDGRSIGQIYIVLFTEAIPEIVTEFVGTCTKKGKKKPPIEITRIFPELWMEGIINFDRKISLESTKRDFHAIDHSIGPGVISMKKKQLADPKTGTAIEFVISFAPLPLLNGNQLAFGKVVKGLKILTALQENGTKFGKIKKMIKITSCGLIV